MNKKRAEKIALSLNVIDDTLFQKMAEDKGFCEELLSTVLEQPVTVESIVPQSTIKNLQGRSVVLDALCVLQNGKRCNVEVQKANDDNHEKRLRYNTSCITANITDPGTKFEKVPDVIGIIISKFDMFNKRKTVYHIDRTIRETGDVSENGLQEIYVNTKIDDGSDIAELMRIYKEQETYDYEKFPHTSKRKQQFVVSEGGQKEMCEIVENYAKEVAEEAAKKAAKKAAKSAARRATKRATKENEKTMAKKLFARNVDFDTVLHSVENITVEELKKIYEEVKRISA